MIPNQELTLWKTMAAAYLAYCSKQKYALSSEARKEVYTILLLCSMNSEQNMIDQLGDQLKVLTKQDAIDVIQSMKHWHRFVNGIQTSIQLFNGLCYYLVGVKEKKYSETLSLIE